MVKNSKSALWALAAAGGLWAWQNRDKLRQLGNNPQVRDAINSVTGQQRQPSTPHSSYPSTGATRRIDMETSDDATKVQRDPFASGI
ncbi:MAG TPA: hypothetical protein VFS21_05245 [Roseiflexaceae bacterium]|nr:hypothetical protein [Roseiflexaceae bacterium]